MLNKINDLAKALPQEATLLTISKDLFDQLNSQFYPKEKISVAVPGTLQKVHTENGVLDITIVDDKVNYLSVT